MWKKLVQWQCKTAKPASQADGPIGADIGSAFFPQPGSHLKNAKKVTDYVAATIATYDQIAPHYAVTATPENRIMAARGGFEFWLCKK